MVTRRSRSTWASSLLLLLSPLCTYGATVNFTGLLDFVDLDAGGAIYSGTATGTRFTGAIDDASFGGFITDGTTRTDFSCCIAAGGIDATDNFTPNAEMVERLNSWLGPGFFAVGQQIDLIDLEGDAQTAGGGRIEVGISWVLHPDAFAGTGTVYPFDPAKLYLTLFFIEEEDAGDDTILEAMGRVDAVPLPASAWLFLAGVMASLRFIRRTAREQVRR